MYNLLQYESEHSYDINVSDPETIKFLKGNIDPVFGFPQLVRFSWSTAQKILDENAVLVDWFVDNIALDFTILSITV